MDKTGFTVEQLLLARIRDERCGGNAAELARKIKKDSTYVNRLFYPIGKKGRKGVGLEVMRACTEEFKLPPGYWEGAEQAATPPSRKGAVFERLTAEEEELIDHYRHVLGKDRRAVMEELRGLAAERKSEREELFANAGLDAIAERAAHASRRRTAGATVEAGTAALKQRSLLDD